MRLAAWHSQPLLHLDSHGDISLTATGAYSFASFLLALVLIVALAVGMSQR